jgi:alpha-beta hydrolase superfamily lysophospholipase
LSAKGFAVLRFDYPGTGDSTDLSPDDVIVEQWTSSVPAMVAALRHGGAQRVAVIALRMGAVLATAGLGASEARVDAALLWDPSVSGRLFLRSQRILLKLSLENESEPPEGELPGFTLSGESTKRLEELKFANAGNPIAPLVHLVLRPGQSAERHIAGFPGSVVTSEPGGGESELFDVPVGLSHIPLDTLDNIVSWADGLGWAADQTIALPVRERATVHQAAGGAQVEEYNTVVGSPGLSGITTQPSNGIDRLPTLLFLDVATEHHIGPSRLWVQLARDLAEHGFRSIRFDFSGQGDSPYSVLPPPYDLAKCTGELSDVISSLSQAETANVVIIGLCSGAYHALEVASRRSVAGVCAISPILDYVNPSDLPVATNVMAIRRPWVRALGAHPAVKKLQRKLPRVTWQALDRLGVVTSAAHALVDVVDRGANTLVICGERDARPFQQRGHWLLRQAYRSGRFRFERVDGMDHSLLLSEAREHAYKLIYTHLLATFVPKTELYAPGDSTMAGTL